MYYTKIRYRSEYSTLHLKYKFENLVNTIPGAKNKI
jgi:hypothetical protein